MGQGLTPAPGESCAPTGSPDMETAPSQTKFGEWGGWQGVGWRKDVTQPMAYKTAFLKKNGGPREN